MEKKTLLSDDGFSELLKGLAGVEAIVPKNTFDNIFTIADRLRKNYLNEAYYATYPIDEVVKFLKKRYGKTANVERFDGGNGEDAIMVVMGNADYNQNIVDSDLLLCGYFPLCVEEKGKQRNVTYEKI